MNFVRTHKKISILVLIVLILLLLFSFTFARYIYNIVDNYILESKGFYFNSSVLKVNNKKYKVNNWDGVNSYSLTIDVNNQKNDTISTDHDISYVTNIECPDTVVCRVSKNDGIIYKNKNTDSYVVTITPKKNFYSGDEVEIMTSVRSVSPYEKELSATYIIGVLKKNFSYSIMDNKNDKSFILDLTNSITYYEVKTAFLNYNIGDQVSVDVYKSLSNDDKKKCVSARVTIEFDPNKVLLDMTNNTYLKRNSGTLKTVKINNFDYVSKYTFDMNASSNEKIIFYKKDISKDYTYPIVNDSSVINVSVETAN